MPPPHKYLPLGRYLLALPPEQGQVRLTLTEIEALVGELPVAAGLYAFWSGSNLARLNWRLEGFTVSIFGPADPGVFGWV